MREPNREHHDRQTERRKDRQGEERGVKQKECQKDRGIYKTDRQIERRQTDIRMDRQTNRTKDRLQKEIQTD